jgi:hypothetical protein
MNPEDMTEEYEQGYQDGMMDAEQEMFDSVNPSINTIQLDNVMGVNLLTVTLKLSENDRLYHVFLTKIVEKRRNRLSTPLENFVNRTYDDENQLIP